MRELEAVLEQAMIFRSGDWITPEDLALSTRPGVTGVVAVGEWQEAPPVNAALGWVQQEALRVVSEGREVRRRDIIARCRVSREAARRALADLVQLGLLRRIGLGRSARYGRLSFLFTLMSDIAEWAVASV